MTVSGIELDRIGKIREIAVVRETNRHASGRIELLALRSDAADLLAGKVGTQIKIADEQQVFLTGILKKVSGSVTYQKTVLTLEVVSASVESDQTPLCRVFQSPDKTLRQIVRALSGRDVDIPDAAAADAVIEEVILQKDETDFSFLIRLAAGKGLRLFPEDTGRLTLSAFRGGWSDTVSPDDMRNVSFSVGERETWIEFSSLRWFDAGRLRISGTDYAVVGTRIRETGGTLHYTYRLCSGQPEQAAAGKMHIASVGRARVVSCEDPDRHGRLQVELLDAEDCVTGTRRWVPYTPNLTEKSGGVLFCPEPGEIVDVLFQGGELFAVGCVREQAAEDNVKNRVIRIHNTVLDISAGTFRSEKFAADITDELSAQCGKTKITARQEELRIQSDKKIELAASRLNLSGSDKINAKTKAFDVT